MTSNEIAEQDAGTLEVFPPARPHTSTAVAMLHEHAEVYNTAWKLAGQLVQTTMVPKRFFRKQGDATAAILYGAELGLNPIQSLQRVIPVHGMPTLEARTMVGLLKAKGYKVRTTAQSDESVTVEGESPDGEKYVSTWTIERAKRAGYVPTPAPGVTNPRPDEKGDWVTVSKTWDGKTTVSIVGNMKYITDPQTMLKAKGQAETCRELAPDVLMGISYSREELESEDQRQFDRGDDRGATVARVRPVSVDEIFAEEVPLDGDRGDGPVRNNPEPAPAAESDSDSGDPTTDVTPESPAGDVTEDQGERAPDPQPSPAAQTIIDTPAIPEDYKDYAPEPEPTEAKPAKKAPAKKAAPRNVSKLRAPLEKRLFALLKDAGLADEKNRDGRIALYRSLTGRPEVNSTDDLDDVTVGKICDQLYKWQTANVLNDEVEAILLDAAREAEETSAAPAAEPTSEGTE